MSRIDDLVSVFQKFPGLGRKSARRIAFYLMKQDTSYLAKLGGLIANLREGLCVCSECGNISDRNPCSICSDQLRDRKTLCIVEDIEALDAFEDAGIYNGVYHILGGKVSPLNGEDLSDESINFLLKHIKKLKAEEVIIATSPKVEGDLTYYTLLDVLRDSKVKKISRLAYGLPVGGSIEFADKLTLHMALDARRQVM